MKTLDAVITPRGPARVEIVYPRGVLGKDGKGRNVKVKFNSGATAWFREQDLIKSK